MPRNRPIASSPRLSIVIPAYNEEARLPGALARLQTFLADKPYPWEILVVSNGSTDRTAQVVRKAMSSLAGLQLIILEQRGKGVASRTGVLQARGEIVFLCDADLSMPPETIDRFLPLLQQTDVVIGSREASGARRYGEPRHRHVMGRVFNRLVQLLAVPGVEDTQCGFKAFRRTTAEDIFRRQTITGFAFDVEVLFLARKLGYRMQELGIDWYFDADSRVRPGYDSLTMFREVIGVRVRSLLGRYNRPFPITARGRDV
ncbi:MAG: dolichyl-phosphate beta-glucosyltransferase [Chloroflexota bacterium]